MTQKDFNNKVAEVYNQFGETYHKSRKENKGRLHNEFIDMPTVFSLLPKNLDSLEILDAGCGSGLYSIKLAQCGAFVTSVDISSKMIDIAKKETPNNLKIDYLISDLEHLTLKDKKFDHIICAYVLENISNLDQVFKEFSRLLKDTGTCIFSISHPLRANSNKLQINDKIIWQLENYFEKGTRESNFGDGMIVPKFKRTLQDYFNSFNKANFLVKSLVEPTPLKEAENLDPKGYEIACRLPEVLTIQLVKENV